MAVIVNFRPIYDRSHPERLTRLEVKAIEDMALTWGEVMVVRERRLLAQIEALAHDNECLAERIEDLERENATLRAENARLRTTESTMSQAVADVGTRAMRDRERLATAERWLTVIMLALVLAVLFALRMAWTTWR